MSLAETILELERAAWEALCRPTGGAEFYRDRLGEDAVMVFGFGVLDRAAALEAMAAAPPWSWFRIEEPRVVGLSEDCALVTCLATAQREGEAEFSGRTTSVYVRGDAGWKMALHQQTPVR